MNCHYISGQLERIQQAKIDAVVRLSTGGSSGLEEQLQTIEFAISRIRDEMRRRERARAGPCIEEALCVAGGHGEGATRAIA